MTVSRKRFLEVFMEQLGVSRGDVSDALGILTEEGLQLSETWPDRVTLDEQYFRIHDVELSVGDTSDAEDILVATEAVACYNTLHGVLSGRYLPFPFETYNHDLVAFLGGVLHTERDLVHKEESNA